MLPSGILEVPRLKKSYRSKEDDVVEYVALTAIILRKHLRLTFTYGITLYLLSLVRPLRKCT
jgi:hypothetical protein